jgi:adenosylmethionine-8-amino-7-oxononanoate aminotransferase
MHPLARLDHRYLWHPFTQMREWLKKEPIVIIKGRGAELQDSSNRRYLDGNSSIWTNLHGHNHPKISQAIRRQLNRIAHSSALGLANEPAALLAEKLVLTANPARVDKDPEGRVSGKSFELVRLTSSKRAALKPALTKVFFSDDGSTALEVALKLAFEYSRRIGQTRNPRFLSLEGGYHGDTVGAVSLGHIDLFHKAYEPLLFRTDKVMAPYCYRCPYNRARPERADARTYRKCNWECIDRVEEKFHSRKRKGRPFSGFVFEPLMQGAAGMIPQPKGWLSRASEIARGYGALLIADEVMTGFGRMGTLTATQRRPAPQGMARTRKKSSDSLENASHAHIQKASSFLFASHQEGVQPDFMVLAKGLTGGYLPMAATLTTQAVFDAFLGEYEEFKTFFHGHSFTANQIGAAAGLASLALLETPASQRSRRLLEQILREELKPMWRYPQVGDIRQTGLVVGIELVKNWRTREPFDLRVRAGIRVCEEMARRGVLTRPVGNVVVLMPPYCTTSAQLKRMVNVLGESIVAQLGGPAATQA